MGKVKNLIFSFNGYSIKGTCIVRHPNGTTKWILMESFELPFKELTHNNLKRKIDTSSYGKEHAIIEAYLSIYRSYGTGFDQFSRIIKLNELQCKEAITKKI